MYEGKNRHFTPDCKPLCSYSGKLCRQRRLSNFGFCIRHILEDKSAPFRQCIIPKTERKTKTPASINNINGKCTTNGHAPSSITNNSFVSSTSSSSSSSSSTYSHQDSMSKFDFTEDEDDENNVLHSASPSNRYNISKRFGSSSCSSSNNNNNNDNNAAVINTTTTVNNQTLDRFSYASNFQHYMSHAPYCSSYQLRSRSKYEVCLVQQLEKVERNEVHATTDLKLPMITLPTSSIPTRKEFLMNVRQMYKTRYKTAKKYTKASERNEKYNRVYRMNLVALMKNGSKYPADVFRTVNKKFVRDFIIKEGQDLRLLELPPPPPTTTTMSTPLLLSITNTSNSLNTNNICSTTNIAVTTATTPGIVNHSDSTNTTTQSQSVLSDINFNTKPPDQMQQQQQLNLVSSIAHFENALLNSVSSSDTAGTTTDASFDSPFNNSNCSQPDYEFSDDDLELQIDPDICNEASLLEDNLAEVDFNELFTSDHHKSIRPDLSDLEFTSGFDTNDIDYSVFANIFHNVSRTSQEAIPVTNQF